MEERYFGHGLTDISLSFNPEEYWAVFEAGTPIAGVQVSPQLWRIEKLPGFAGEIALKALPKIPIARSLINPRAWPFLKLGNVLFAPGRPEVLFELVEDLFRRYQVRTAALYIDHRSPIYHELRISASFGILDPLMHTKVNVWGFLKHLQQRQILDLHNQPLAISALDI